MTGVEPAGVELSEAEAESILLAADDGTLRDEVFATVERIIAARLSPVEAERDDAVLLAKMDRNLYDERARADAAEARAAKAEALVEAGLGLADEWDQIHLTGFCDSCAGISLGNQRWIAKRIRVVLGGAK